MPAPCNSRGTARRSCGSSTARRRSSPAPCVRTDILTAVRTGGDGAGGISLLLIDAAQPRRSSDAPCRACAGTTPASARIEFRDVRVPLERLIGPENRGFAGLAAAIQHRAAERCRRDARDVAHRLAEAIAWAQRARGVRQATRRAPGGAPQARRPGARHSCGLRISGSLHLAHCSSGEQPVADIAMLKVLATRTLERCARDAMHVLGGPGLRRRRVASSASTARPASLRSAAARKKFSTTSPRASSASDRRPTLRYARGKIDVTDEETLQQIMEATLAPDNERFLGFLTDDVEYQFHVGSQGVHGKDGVRKFMSPLPHDRRGRRLACRPRRRERRLPVHRGLRGVHGQAHRRAHRAPVHGHHGISRRQDREVARLLRDEPEGAEVASRPLSAARSQFNRASPGAPRCRGHAVPAVGA